MTTTARTTALLVLAMASMLLGLAQAQGSTFPFYDACRKNAKCSSKILTPLKPTTANGVVQHCFEIKINRTQCTVEEFKIKSKTFISRCCQAGWAKIKMFVNAECRPQFMPSNVKVPLNTSYTRLVSPTWDKRAPNYAEVKYTQFGPVPVENLDGAQFCLNLKQAGKCDVKSLLGVTNPVNVPKRIFQVALYDRKKDEYECCPTFTMDMSV